MACTAFVLGGGGVLGAVEVGMLRALARADITPDLIVATSIGAINGAMVAADPTPAVTDQLVRLWAAPEMGEVYGESIPRQLRRFATRTHLHSPLPLRRLLEKALPGKFEDLGIPLHLGSVCVERAAESWFSTGPLLPAVMAAAAVPGLLPPVDLDGEHYVDGGIVNSLPIARAVELGAQDIYALHVGRLDKPLSPPQRPWEVAQTAMEIGRRARLARDLASLPEGVSVHVLPVGEGNDRDDNPWAYRDAAGLRRRVSAAYAASRDYLAAQRDGVRNPPR
ncbi:patatin-like phospholipase family protein [Hamadaea sp. NPDC050747]|uniref:patatin-like phospholipase family protein n=1 Tax=Hamadaea sp. NPDC050747 TaxID=3155789 RepID=UPI0033CFFB8D